MIKSENPNQELEECIQLIFDEHDDNYGYRRIHLELKKHGFHVNHKKVQRIMKKLGLKVTKFTRKSRKYSSYKGTVGNIAKNRIKRRFYTNVCHQKLTTDITEFKCSDGVIGTFFKSISFLFVSRRRSFKRSRFSCCCSLAFHLRRTETNLRWILFTF